MIKDTLYSNQELGRGLYDDETEDYYDTYPVDEYYNEDKQPFVTVGIEYSKSFKWTDSSFYPRVSITVVQDSSKDCKLTSIGTMRIPF